MTREEIENNRQYQLTGAAIDYCRENHPYYDGDTLGEITDAFEAGAEWEHKSLVDKLCNLIEENIDYACLHLGNYMEREVDAKELSEWIRKVLEE